MALEARGPKVVEEIVQENEPVSLPGVKVSKQRLACVSTHRPRQNGLLRMQPVLRLIVNRLRIGLGAHANQPGEVRHTRLAE